MNKNLLCLKWDQFDNFVVNGLSNLYQKDDMSDTTLFCDGRSFKAHKIVLSMWSGYFREIFATITQSSNPVIVLRETSSADLELILRFIYQGQLFIPCEDTERFLKTAEYFQVAGLRDMRVHLSADNISVGVGVGSATAGKQSNSAVGIHGSLPGGFQNNTGGSNGGSSGLTTATQPFVSPSTSYGSVDGIPVQILGTSPSFSGHSGSTLNPISIITPSSNGAFSTNVIKPIPNRQQSNRPAVSVATSSALVPTLYNGNALSNPHYRQTSELSCASQPILILQKPTDYHETSKSAPETRPSEQVLVFERVGGQVGMEKKQLLGVDDNVVGSYSQMQQDEEVLGIAYLNENHSNSRSSAHSQIIHEAAMAAGVDHEDNELMDISRDSLMTSESINGNGKLGKASNHPTISSPVYAIKRVPSLPPPSAASASEGVALNAKPGIAKAGTSGIQKQTGQGKIKRTRRPSVQNPDVELVNCPKCDKRVKKTSLKVHIKRTHLEEGTVLTCQICGKHLSSKGVYYKHMHGHRQRSQSAGNDTKSIAQASLPKATTNANQTAQQSRKESRPS